MVQFVNEEEHAEDLLSEDEQPAVGKDNTGVEPGNSNAKKISEPSPKPPDKPSNPKPLIPDISPNTNPNLTLLETTLTDASAGNDGPVLSAAPVNQRAPKENYIVVPKPIKNQLSRQHQMVEEENNGERIGKDMDEETTTQNFTNIARQCDLSPRQIDKVNSFGRGKKKQQR